MATARRQQPDSTSPRASASRASGGLHGLRQHLMREGSAACSAVGHAAGLVCHPSCRYASPRGCAKPPRLPLASAACDPAAHPDCRGRLSVGYQITAARLQGQIEFAYRTDWTQVTTTILWGGQLDDYSRRVLTGALRAAANEARPVRIHAFAAAARDLFRHSSQTLAARRMSRWLYRSTGCPVRDPPWDTAIAEIDPLHGDLLVAIDDLCKAACLQPRVTIVDCAEADDSLQDALSALQELSDLLGDYLELVLQPLTLPVSRDAIHAFIQETRREVDELAACHAVGGVYVESLNVIDPGDKSVNIEIEGSWDAAGP